MRLVLGSASPRRRELLAHLGVEAAEIRPAPIDESPRPKELPRAYCLRMAREKAAALPCAPDEALLTADTTVAVGRRILGQPQDEDDARAFLTLLSGRRHRVYTAVVLRTAERQWERLVTSTVRFKRLSQHEIEAYVKSGEWQGKAGGYAIQGRAAAFIPWMAGSFSGVVGLPLYETAQLLRAAGVLR